MLTGRCIALMILVFCCFCIVNSEIKDLVVETDIGFIKGLRADDGDYTMFLGVPFAQINASNPFGMAIPHPGFENVFEAYDDYAPCPQREEHNLTLVGSLNCLKLNIFVPDSASAKNRLPVLAYVFGGGFTDGYYDRYIYGAKFLVKHDIILVSINYRGGPYGFMCLDIPEVPGNQGLKDQVLALRWIKRHIGTFGGDDTKITLGGHSAGSISIDLHLQSNNEKLYDKVILQSGTSLIPIFNQPIRRAPIILSEYLGYPTSDLNAAIDFLAKQDTYLVIIAAESSKIMEKFKPCVEKEFDGVESFITKNWHTGIMPKVKNIPVLIGITYDEMCGYSRFKKEEDYQNTVKETISKLFAETNDFKSMVDLVHKFYFGDEPPSSEFRESVINFDSDIHFLYPTYKTIERYLDSEAGNIFLQVFSYIGDRNYVRILWNATNCGSQHGDDMAYLFDMIYLKHIPITKEDQHMIDRMTLIWSNFIKFSNPVPQITDLLPIQWTPITKQSGLPYLDINTKLEMKFRPFRQRASFWKLFYKVNEHLHIAYPNRENSKDYKYKQPTSYKTEL